jgi:diguanylate cyclase (GGDEF)-like protein
MTRQRRRSLDTLREVDGLLEAHLQDARIDGRPLANLAAAMAIEHSGAERGALLIATEDGIETVVALEGDLSLSAGRKTGYDVDLVAEAVSTQRTCTRDGRIAAPVTLDRLETCLLYLEGAPERLGEEAVELAGGVATRIGALLRSAAMVEELALRTRNVTTLEALSTCLAAGELLQEHIDRAIEGALSATRSDDALLTLVEAREASLHTTVRGERADELLSMERTWIDQLTQGNFEELGGEISGVCLVEPFWADLVPTGGARPTVGFMAVRRHAVHPAYDEADRSFFRAVAHLISGALARMDYFNKAAEDPLTATGSRLALQLGLAEAQANALATGRAYSLILLDIDEFKQINDRWGHLAGDEVLRGLAGALRSRLRSTDSVARFGGDEFVIILPQTEAEQAARVAEQLRILVRGLKFGEHGIDVTVSIGVASSPDVSDLKSVLEAADLALYRSKSQGRDRVTIFDQLTDAR